MIEKMLKTSVICKGEDAESVLVGLRDLGILHVRQTVEPAAAELPELSQKIEKINVAINSLAEYKNLSTTYEYGNMSPEELSELVTSNLSELGELKKNLDLLKRDHARLEPWGDFRNETITQLRQNGFFVYLCVGMMSTVESCGRFGAVEVISKSGDTIYFVVVSEKEVPKNERPLAQVPASDQSYSDLSAAIAGVKQRISDCTAMLAGASRQLGKIKHQKALIESEYEFLSNKSGMGQFKELSYISGFIPEHNKAILSESAAQNGWAVLYEEPGEEDRAPTLLKVPKIFRCILPIFDFIGVYPGYFEWDVSLFFLFFFTIFYSMILGDAGYGLLFFAACVYFKFKLRKDLEVQNALNLVLVLSAGTMLWGIFTCAYFGIPEEWLPHWMLNLKLSILDDPSVKDKNIQDICFFLGALHLSCARLYKAWIYRGKLKALGNVGWAMFIWANYFMLVKLVAYPDYPLPGITPYLYIIGAVLVLAFYVHWTDVGSVFHAPFSFIGSFVDVLSYIRLFAVGLAGAYIVICFLNMAQMIAKISPVCIIFAILIMVFAHLLNIALALMGVLVHGVRLNTLEFSNQMGLEWTGVAYKPFKNIQTK